MKLQSLYVRFRGESDWLMQQFDCALSLETRGLPTTWETRAWRGAREMCLIRMQDAWTRFCRELVIASAYRQPITAAGLPILRAPGCRTRSEVVSVLSRRYANRPGSEPPWHIPLECIQAAAFLKVVNFPTISAAVGSSPNPLDDLRPLRNYVAHRSPSTVARVQHVARSNSLSINVEAVDLAADLLPLGQQFFRLLGIRLQRMAWAAIQ